MTDRVTLDGNSLTVEDVVSVARDHTPVTVSPEAVSRIEKSRKRVEDAVARGEVIYGINTGFGKLASVRIPQDQLAELQRNLIRSHVSGVGPYLSVEVVRAIMVLRINVLVRETSGVRPEMAQRLTDMLNAGIHPLVPEQGSVGASGDLAPLSHVALGLMGEGEVLRQSGADDDPIRTSAADALKDAGIAPLEFQSKEGLAFINGTQAQTAILALLIYDAENLWRSAVGATAMSLEALQGTPTAFDERIHRTRPHLGQERTAALLRKLLEQSEIRESHRTDDPRVQDAYSLRCAPQILGPVWDAIEFCRGVVDVELNSSTDNPLVLGDEILSGGNFHGQVVAQALDFITTSLTSLAGVAERRVERLVNPDLSYGLPAFLTPRAGVQSGFMMLQITAAALVAESRTLCTPASVQSIPTDANQEDYVPMGMAAAVKARRVLGNAQRVVAIELICGAQGLDFLRPLKPGQGVQQIYRKVRDRVAELDEDRPLSADVERLGELLAKEAMI